MSKIPLAKTAQDDVPPEEVPWTSVRVIHFDRDKNVITTLYEHKFEDPYQAFREARRHIAQDISVIVNFLFREQKTGQSAPPFKRLFHSLDGGDLEEAVVKQSGMSDAVARLPVLEYLGKFV